MATAPRRAWLRRLGCAAAIVAALLGGALLFVRSDWFGRQVTRLLEAAIEAATGEHAVVAGLSADLLHARVRADGIVLSHVSPDPDRDGRPIFAAESVEVAVGWRAGRPAVAEVAVVRPVVRLHVDADGLREFRGRPRSDGGARRELPAIRVQDGSVRVEGVEFAAAIEGLNVAPAGPGASRGDAGLVDLRYKGLQRSASAVRIDGVVLGPDRVLVPDLDLDFGDLRLSGSFGAVAGGALGGDLTLEGDLAALNPLVAPALLLSGTAAVDAELGGTTEAPVATGALLVRGATVERARTGRSPRLYEVGDLHAAWALEGTVLSLEPLIAPWGGGQVEVAGALDLATLGVRATVVGEGLEFTEVLRQVDVSDHAWVAFEADTEVQVGGTFSPLAVSGSFEVATRGLEVAGGPAADPRNDRVLAIPVLRVGGEVHVAPDRVRLVAHEIATRKSRGRAVASIGFRGDGPLDLFVDFPTLYAPDLAPLGDVDLRGTANLVGRLQGPFGELRAAGRLVADDLHVFGIPFADRVESPFESDLRVLRFPEMHATRRSSSWSGQLALDFVPDLTLDLQVLLPRFRIADLTGMFIDLPEVDGDLAGALSLHGDPYALSGEADIELEGVDAYGEHLDRGTIFATMDAGRFTLDDLTLTRRDGAEGLMARGSVGAGWAVNVEARASGVRLERLDHVAGHGVSLQGEALADVVVGGTLFEPEPRGRLAARDTWFAGRRVGDTTLTFETDDGVCSFHGNVAGNGLDVAGTIGLWGEQPYDLSLDFHDFPLHTLYPVAADGQPVAAHLTGRARLGGRFGDDPTPVDIEGQADAFSLAWGGHQLRSVGPWRYVQHGRDFHVDGIGISGGATDLRFAGGRDAQGRLDARGGGTVDLDLLRALVGDLHRAEGTAQVEIAMTGNRGEVDTTVTARVQDALFQGTWVPEAFEEVDLTLVGRADGYELASASGRLGGGAWSASGRIDADSWVPLRYDLDATATNVRVRYFDWLPPLVGDARFSFDGPSDALLLAGRVDVHEVLFSDRIDWESWVLEMSGDRLAGAASEASEAFFDMDIEVVADRSVRMRNNVADLECSARLRVVGDTARPGFFGDVRATPGGRVYLKEREFEVARGEIHFVDPFTYDPTLDIALTTEVRTREEEFALDYRVTGLYSDWRAETSSNPALPQADINALLLFGMTREELERYGGLREALWIEGSDLLASKFGIVERVNEGIFRAGALRPDRIDLVSGSSARGSQAISSDLRLLAEKDVGREATIIIEQRVPDISGTYIGLERRLARKLYSRGYWSSEQIGRHLDIGGAWGVEFNVRWETD